VIKLAETSVGMPMEGANQAGVAESLCARPKRTIPQRSFELAPDVKSAAEIFAKGIHQLLHTGQWVFGTEPKTLVLKILKGILKDLQLPALNHVCNHKGKSMAAEGQEDAGLIKNPPHSLRNVILHIFPSVNTRVVVTIILKKFHQ
jgi:hypothetical protein